MTRISRIAAAVGIAVCVGAQAPASDPFEQGIAAYKRLDYKNAMRLIRPLADSGKTTNRVG